MRISREAELDMLEIWNYIAEYDSFESADHVLDMLESTITKIKENPGCGHLVPELENVDIFTFFEFHCKPWRLIYKKEKQRILLFAVIDGRRHVQAVLQKRITRP